MSPDSALGLLAQRVAKMEQRVDDLATRAVERIADLAEAIRDARSESTRDYEAFGPMLRDHAELRADLRHLTEDVNRLHTSFAGAVAEFRKGLDDLEQRLEREARERQAIREAREEKERERERQRKKEREDRQVTERRDKWARRIQTVAVALTFVSTSIAVVVFIVGQQRGH